MDVFGQYSKYYDLLYKDKNYQGEAAYIHQLVQKYNPGANSIFEMGCGTGRHSTALTRFGYHVFGIDMSQEMLNQANDLISHEKLEQQISVKIGDVRNFRVARRFDTCISLFHVMSYQTTNEDLVNAFNTASTHLNPKGCFIFDCWYGPAVLRQLPEKRKKVLEDDGIKVTRYANPVLDVNNNIVNVNYDIEIIDKNTSSKDSIAETHSMRYLFKPEIQNYLELAGLQLIDCFSFMSDELYGADTWSVCFVGRKI